jgi:hypothetical protein
MSFEDFDRFENVNELPSFSPDYAFEYPPEDFSRNDFDEPFNQEVKQEFNRPSQEFNQPAPSQEFNQPSPLPFTQEVKEVKKKPRRKIVRGKIDDIHLSKDDPTVRHRTEHVKILLSHYGLRNDQLTEDGKEKRLDPDASLNRLNPPFFVTLGGIRRQFSTKNYLNRHIISPMELDDQNYYYRIDDSSKNEEYQGVLIEVIGAKWIGSSSKITWKCKKVGSGETFYSLYIDATSRISKSNTRVQEYLRAKELDAKMCFREDTVTKLITTLESAAREMRNEHL